MGVPSLPSPLLTSPFLQQFRNPVACVQSLHRTFNTGRVAVELGFSHSIFCAFFPVIEPPVPCYRGTPSLSYCLQWTGQGAGALVHTGGCWVLESDQHPHGLGGCSGPKGGGWGGKDGAFTSATKPRKTHKPALPALLGELADMTAFGFCLFGDDSVNMGSFKQCGETLTPPDPGSLRTGVKPPPSAGLSPLLLMDRFQPDPSMTMPAVEAQNPGSGFS